MVDKATYAPLWILTNKRKSINGFNPVYELEIERLLYTIVILTLIFAVVYLVFVQKKRECRIQEDREA